MKIIKIKSILPFLICILSSIYTNAQVSLWVGESYTFDVSSSVMGITTNVSWSTNGGYLSLSGSGFYRTITVTKYFSGSATVTCEWDYKLTSNGTYTHTKRQLTISCIDNQVSISPQSMTMQPGESRYVNYFHQYDNQYTSFSDAYFASSDPTIASVNQSSGEVEANRPGSTQIYVYSKLSSVSPFCNVFVEQVEPNNIEIPTSIDLIKGQQIQIKPILTPAYATTNYVWDSSDESIASVSSEGIVTAKEIGDVIITVETSNGLKDQCIVVVEEYQSDDLPLKLIDSNVVDGGTIVDNLLYFTFNKPIQKGPLGIPTTWFTSGMYSSISVSRCDNVNVKLSGIINIENNKLIIYVKSEERIDVNLKIDNGFIQDQNGATFEEICVNNLTINDYLNPQNLPVSRFGFSKNEYVVKKGDLFIPCLFYIPSPCNFSSCEFTSSDESIVNTEESQFTNPSSAVYFAKNEGQCIIYAEITLNNGDKLIESSSVRVLDNDLGLDILEENYINDNIIELFNLQGQRIYSGFRDSIPPLKPSIYILKIGSFAKKIFLNNRL